MRDFEVEKFADNITFFGFFASRCLFVTYFPYEIEFSYGVEWPAGGLEVPDGPPRASLGRVCPYFPGRPL